MAIFSLGALILFAVSTGLQFLLRPRIKRPRGPDAERPRAREGEPIPIGYGVFAVAPNIVWWGDAHQATNKEKGYTYYSARAVGTLCLGEVTALKDIQFGGKSIRFEPLYGNQSTNGDATYVISPGFETVTGGIENTDGEPIEFDINARGMFGGAYREGGVEGQLRFYWGTLDQPVDEVTDAYYQALGLSGGSGRPGVCYAVFGDNPQSGDDVLPFYLGTVPTPKDIVFLLQHIPNALELGAIGEDANPAEILYDLLTHDLRGLGLSPDLIDTDSFIHAGNILAGRGNGASTFADSPPIGLSCLFTSQDEVEDMIEDVLKHIEGVCEPHPVTGLYTLKLLRPDYVVADLPLITTTHRGTQFANARDVVMDRPHWGETSNDLTLRYRRFEAGPGAPKEGEILTEDLQLSSMFQNIHAAQFQVPGRNIGAVIVYADGVPLTVLTDYIIIADRGIIIIRYTAATAAAHELTIDYTPNPRASAYIESVARAQDLASIDQSGARPLTVDYSFYTNPLAAGWKVARLLRQVSRPLAQFKWVMNREGYALTKGDVVLLVHDFGAGEASFAVRVGGVDYGLLEQGEITVTGVEDVYGVDVVPMLPAPSTPTGGSETPAPSMAIGYAATSAIRVCLFPSDTTFNIELERADDVSGTNATTISSTIPGTTTHYDDTQTPPVQKAYRARLVPTSSQVGFTVGPWTARQLMTATAGTPGACTCTIPVVAVSTSDDGVTATLTLTLDDSTDPQRRASKVEFQTQAGTGPLTAWTEDATAPYTASVARVAGSNSTISYRVTYLNCSGTTTSDLSGTITFPLTSSSGGNNIIELGELVYEDGNPLVE